MSHIIEAITETEDCLTPIQKFYCGANVFITGATGFLGRLLLEKLLRSCPDLSTIYILIRDKKGKSIQNRLDDLFEDIVFERLKKEQPKFRHKVVAVEGDCSLPELGLNMQERQLLVNEVNIVFHVAATVRFDEKLKLAVATNVKGVQDIIKLSKGMRKLKSIVYVSTAYSNCPRTFIEEKFYPSPLDYKGLISLSEVADDNLLNKITPIILKEWPNTYAYTKAVAEDVVRSESDGLPMGVFRPSIIISTYQEPIKGWINNLYGPTGVVASAGAGLLHSLHCKSNVNANIVPVDMCVNSLIALAWDVGEQYSDYRKNNKHFDIPIYHFESSEDQPISWGEFMCKSERGLFRPLKRTVWYYYLTLQPTLIGHVIVISLLHLFPAALCDLYFIVTGKSPRMLKVYKKIHKFSGVISYFCTRSWKFDSNRVRSMLRKMTVDDQRIFFCNLQGLNWDKYFEEYFPGVRMYLLQDPLETLKDARIRWKRLHILHQVLSNLVILLVLRLLWPILSGIFFWYL